MSSGFTQASLHGVHNPAPLMSPALAPPIPRFRPPDVKLRKMELPKFSGLRKHWPEFKTMWTTLAVPSFSSKVSLAEMLRTHVEGKAKDMLEGVQIVGPGAYDDMWEKLLRHYDDIGAAVESALSDLKKLRPLKEEDWSGLVRLVDEVESTFRQLATWHQRHILTQLHVNDIENLLPPSVRTVWRREIRKLDQVQRLHPFPVFLEFLMEERAIWAIPAERQQIPQSRKSSHFGQSSSYDEPKSNEESRDESRSNEGPKSYNGSSKGYEKPKFYKCAVHRIDTCKHATSQCSEFKKLTLKEKSAAIRSAGACYRCFGAHMKNKCREKLQSKKPPYLDVQEVF